MRSNDMLSTERDDLRVDVAFASHIHSQVLGRVNRPTRSMPVADLDVVGRGVALSGFEQLLEAHQVDGPLGAAVVHELHRLTPAFVSEQHDGEAVLLLELEANLRADPL